MTWCLVTDLDKVKQGIATALSLLECDASGISDNTFNELTFIRLN